MLWHNDDMRQLAYKIYQLNASFLYHQNDGSKRNGPAYAGAAVQAGEWRSRLDPFQKGLA